MIECLGVRNTHICLFLGVVERERLGVWSVSLATSKEFLCLNICRFESAKNNGLAMNEKQQWFGLINVISCHDLTVYALKTAVSS